MTAVCAALCEYPRRLGEMLFSDWSKDNALTTGLKRLGIIDGTIDVVGKALSVSLHFGGSSEAQMQARTWCVSTRDLLACFKIFSGIIPDLVKRCQEFYHISTTFCQNTAVVITKKVVTSEASKIEKKDLHYHSTLRGVADKVMGLVISLMGIIGDGAFILAFGPVRALMYTEKYFHVATGKVGHHIMEGFQHLVTVMHLTGLVRQLTTLSLHVKKYMELPEADKKGERTEFLQKMVTTSLASAEKLLEVTADALHYARDFAATPVAAALSGAEAVLALTASLIGLANGWDDVFVDTKSAWWNPDWKWSF